MLAISPGAAQVINQVVSSAQIPEQGGLRISAQPIDSENVRLDLGLAPSPQPGDAIVEQQGVNVFLDQQVAPLLDDKVLDATVDGDEVSFAIREQPQSWSNNGRPEEVDPRDIS